MRQPPGAGPTICMDKQGKHIPGHNNFQLGKSEWTHPDPQALLDLFGGTGIRNGHREMVSFGLLIEFYVNPVTGSRTPTTRGVIHYDHTAGAHIVPTGP